MKQLKAALERAGLDRGALPPGKKNSKPKRVGKRSTGEITLRGLRALLLSQAALTLEPHEVTIEQKNAILTTLIGMAQEVEERLDEYEAEREAQQRLNGKS
jgi:hypothetical protein